MSQEIRLQTEAQKIILTLQETNVPHHGLNYFTVGDSFRYDLLRLKSDILKLSNSNTRQLLEKIVIGDFGTGKTHFLNYLQWLLEKELMTQCVISKVDLSYLNSPDKLQLMIIKGMKMTGDKGDYGKVLHMAYDSIQKQLIHKRLSDGKILDEQERQKFYATILYYLLGKVTGGWVTEGIVKLLGQPNWIDSLSRQLSKRNLDQTYQEAKSRSSDQDNQFIETYLQIIQDPQAPKTHFETHATELSKTGKLTDLIFKVLKFSQTKMLVILIDELEAIKGKGDEFLTQLLVNIRALRDTLSYPDFPSITIIFASTGQMFFEEILKKEPALHSRWKGKEIILERFSEADIDNLIFKLRELYYLAGYPLKSIERANNMRDHGVVELRKQILKDYENEPTGLSSRELIGRLLNDIETIWF